MEFYDDGVFNLLIDGFDITLIGEIGQVVGNKLFLEVFLIVHIKLLYF